MEEPVDSVSLARRQANDGVWYVGAEALQFLYGGECPLYRRPDVLMTKRDIVYIWDMFEDEVEVADGVGGDHWNNFRKDQEK